MEAEINDILSLIADRICPPKTELKAISPLTFAFVGDAVYSLIIRTAVVNRGNMANQKLHKKSTEYVSAKAQAQMADYWLQSGMLTAEELDVLKRGINTKTHSQAKNASTAEYHKATGVEVLSGYLYLKGELSRLIELMAAGMDI